MTLLACIAKDGAKIEPAVCVQEQVEERCFCPKAPIAISEVSTGTPDPRLKHQMPVLRARAEAMYRKDPGQRYAGPALRVHNKEVAHAAAPIVETHTPEAMKPEEGVSPPVEPMQAPTPGSPAGSDIREEVIAQAPRVGSEPRACKALDFKCGNELRSDNKNGLCAEHTRVARTKIGAARLGVTQVLYPRDRRASLSRQIANASVEAKLASLLAEKEKVVPIKPVEAHPLAQVIDSPLKVGEPAQLREPADQAAKFQRVLRDHEGVPLRDPASLPHEYLIACVKEARRRLAALDEHFTFITAKEA